MSTLVNFGANRAQGDQARRVTTRAVGEEGGTYTTLAVGEEGGAGVTRAAWENGGVGPRPQPDITTQAIGEEGGVGITRASWENGGIGPQPRPRPRPQPRPEPGITTKAVGEEGGTRPKPPTNTGGTNRTKDFIAYFRQADQGDGQLTRLEASNLYNQYRGLNKQLSQLGQMFNLLGFNQSDIFKKLNSQVTLGLDVGLSFLSSFDVLSTAADNNRQAISMQDLLTTALRDGNGKTLTPWERSPLWGGIPQDVASFLPTFLKLLDRV